MASNRQYPFQPALPYDEPVEFQVDSMGAGLVRDVESRSAPPESASDIDGVRFEGAAVRKDFGYRELGDPAATRILAIGEHRYFANNSIRNRVMRARRVGGELHLERWSGSEWTLVGTYPEIADVYLSVVSTQNTFVIADGQRILKWQEVPVLQDQNQEFASGEYLRGFDRDTQVADGNPLCGTPVVITPAGAEGFYTIRIRVIWAPLYGSSTVRIPVELKRNGEVFQTYNIEYTPDDADPDPHSVVYEISTEESGTRFDEGDELQICVVQPELTYFSDPMERSGPRATGHLGWTTPHFFTTKHWIEGAEGDGEYIFRFGTNLPASGGFATIGFYHKPAAGVWTKVHEVTYTNPGPPDIRYYREERVTISNVAAGDQLGMHVEATSKISEIGPPAQFWPDDVIIGGRDVAFEGSVAVNETTGRVTDDLFKTSDDIAPTLPNFIETKHWEYGEVLEHDYDFRYGVAVDPGATLTVGFYKRMGGSDPWELIDTEVFDNTAGTDPLILDNQIKTVSIDSFPRGGMVGVSIEDTSMVVTNAEDVITGRIWFRQASTNISGYTVKPANFSDDGVHGISYQTPTGVDENVIDLLSPDAPGARIVFPFGDRLIALRNLNDAQAFAASADGDIEKWVGVDTAELALVDTASDPIDDLMGGAQLSAGVAAIFRKRSIGRAVETGNLDLPVAVVKWIEHLGTESPFSIQLVSRGIAFLGHDMMPYILTEGGPQPIGLGLKKDFTERLAGANLELVDSAYDSVLGEYYLALPSFESPNISEVWIFEVNTFWESGGQQQKWRKRAIEMERIAMVSHLP